MIARSLSHVPDHELIAGLRTLLADGRVNLCEVLLHLGEVDSRRLHLPAAYPSLFEYCVRELHMSKGEAFGRIRAARVVRRFPRVLERLADGRLHLTAVVLLAGHLRSDNADDLVAAVTHRSKSEIQHLLAQRFPLADLPTRILPLAVANPAPTSQPAPPNEPADEGSQLLPATVEFIDVSAPCEPATPLAPERFALHCTLHEQEMADLKRAQELLGRAIPSGDAARVIGRALRVLVEQLEKHVLGEAEVQESSPPAATDTRHVPAAIRRLVWQRDQSQCTFVSASGRRCDSRRDLELDHVQPFARGGRTSVDNLRLRCRAHNQYEADRAYGAGFMAEKRMAGRARVEGPVPAPARPHVDELIPWLMSLKFRKHEACELAEFCAEMPDATLEDRLRVALRGHGRMKYGRDKASATAAAPTSGSTTLAEPVGTG